MIILGIHSGFHNSSVALLKDNKVLFHIENERLSNIKYDENAFHAIQKVKDYVDHIDHLVLTGFPVYSRFDSSAYINDAYASQVYSLNKTFADHGFKLHNYFDKHHETHAATAFYNSGFDSALCIVMDGSGTSYTIVNDTLNPENKKSWEFKSVYKASYPHNFELIEKYLTGTKDVTYEKVELGQNMYMVSTVSEARLFEFASKSLGWTVMDAGKVMGLAPYGKENTKYPPIYKKGYVNIDHIWWKNDQEKWCIDFEIGDTFQDRADYAYMVQKEVQENVAKYILSMLEQTKEKNLCLSGGFFLNCVSNYNLLKQLPKDINLYIEPMCGDAGNAIGAAKELYYKLTKSKEKNPQTNIYYGPKPKYNFDIFKNQNILENIKPSYVANLIAEKNIIALYQGSCESGPRALGNRSLLYDPRDPNGKDHVNSVKKREPFRPFAGTVLLEHANDWFDLCNLPESKYMLFAVDVLENKRKKIPSITHVDGSCRIQTLKREDNKIYYDLINEFYKITGVPILFNTSLNLAGDAINENPEDALRTFNNSKINYLYFADLEILVTK